MTYFSEFMRRTDKRLVSKWTHYFDIYEREFAPFRDRPVSFLEIGVFKGGSIPMWKGYFENAAQLTFIDIDPSCAAHAETGTVVEIGSQADPDFLARIVEAYGPFDIILDDGSHVSAHQIASFNALWPHLNNQGLYVVEDTHCSYWPGFGGGYKDPKAFMEFAKDKQDAMHSWYSEDDNAFPFDPIAEELFSVRSYDSIVVFEKRRKTMKPTQVESQMGKPVLTRAAMSARGRRSRFYKPDES